MYLVIYQMQKQKNWQEHETSWIMHVSVYCPFFKIFVGKAASLIWDRIGKYIQWILGRQILDVCLHASWTGTMECIWWPPWRFYLGNCTSTSRSACLKWHNWFLGTSMSEPSNWSCSCNHATTIFKKYNEYGKISDIFFIWIS